MQGHANAAQQRAIITVDGPLLMIAGPGSGKTFTLVERVVHLIQHRNVSPENLLVVTFTDKAARELTTRISDRLAREGIRFNLNEMPLDTFHSLCLRWLEAYREFTRLKRNFTLLDEFDQQYFLYSRLSGFEALPGSEHLFGGNASPWYKSRDLLKWLNTVSEEALDVETLLSAPDAPIRALGQAAALYYQQLEAANALDFSTIQREVLLLLERYPQVRADLQAKLRYLMVDEYQDTNTVQERLLMLLVGESGNLCVVGDDDQGLYRFRGATIRNILEFSKNFPKGACQQVRLTTNYRSHPDIIELYNRWMREQDWRYGDRSFRYPKRIEARPESFPTVPATATVTASPDRWHQEVLAFLHALRDRGDLTDWNQVAFLFRSVKNPKVKALAEFLEAKGVPVYAPRADGFFDREEVRLVLGALMFLFPQFPHIRKWKDDAHLDIWDYYDERCVRAFTSELRKPGNADLLTWVRATAKRHYTLSDNLDYGFSGLFYQLLRFPLFSRYLDEARLSGDVIDERPMRNLATVSQLLNKFEYLHHLSILTVEHLERDLKSLFNTFLRYLKDGGINEYEREDALAPKGCVSFLTIHQAKGLEFPVVVVGSLDTVPRKQYGDLDELLEPYLSRPPFEPLPYTKFYDFRRLYYTAFSRAQNLLALACPLQTGRWPSPSKYFRDLVDDLPSWRSVPLEQLPLEAIREVALKREYSFTSHLALYETCAEQYRFFRELEFAPVRTNPVLFGTLVHQTIEDIHKTVLRGETHKLSEAQIGAWFDTNYAYLTKKERAYLTPLIKGIALGHVMRYYERYRDDWSHVRDAEVDVSLVKDAYILAGKVDLIQGANDTVEIVDFKSEKKPDVNHPDDRERINRYRRQLEVYAHIVEERTGLEVSKVHLYYTGVESGSPFISFDKNARSLSRTIETFDKVVSRIEAKDFRIAERPLKLCEACDMRSYCDAKNWSFLDE